MATLDMDLSNTCSSVDVIKDAAKMSVVAIPLRYIAGKDNENSNKYCCISNWWKVRSRHGQFVMPTLDPFMYGFTEEQEEEDTVDYRYVL